MNAFLHSPFIREDSALAAKLETIVRFILKSEYQKLRWGHGVIRQFWKVLRDGMECSLEMIERFKNEEGLISFHRGFLSEKRYGCWVLGNRMELENRRTSKAIMCESTFRFIEITSQTG